MTLPMPLTGTSQPKASDSALETLLLEAWDNDLDIRGVWEFRSGQTYPDLEVLVTELAGS